MTRRQALWLGGGALAVAGCAGGAWPLISDAVSNSPPTGAGAGADAQPPALATGALATGGSESYVHVIAHADDGLYFQNPELEQAVRSGRPTAVLCLTGGESNGVNAPDRRGGRPALGVRADLADFARARMNGMRRAFALMATGDENSPWTAEAVSLIPGFQAELNTLRAAPQVQVVWLQLREARSIWGPNPLSLKSLWLGEEHRLPTLPPAESPVQIGQFYRRADVVASIRAVLDAYRPTTVRTLDPNPEHRLVQPPDWGAPHHREVPRLLRLPVYLDHQDHQYSAYFAQLALAEHWSGPRARTGSVEHYLGYVNSSLPLDQDPATSAGKQRLLAAYAWADGGTCGDPAGCGDRKVGPRGARDRWSRSVRYRAPGSTSWVRRLKDRRPAAFGLLNGAVAYWTETAPGSGRWTGPHRPAGAGGRDLEGQLHVLEQPDGRLRLFGVRTRPAGTAAGHRREIVTSVQTAASVRTGSGSGGGALEFSPWAGLGAPDREAVRTMEMGYPAAVLDGRGRIRLFARNWAGGVSSRTGTPGSGDGPGRWEPWTALPTVRQHRALTGVMDGLGVALGGDGRMHVLAAGARGIVHWASAVPDGPLRPQPVTGLPVSAGPVNAVTLPDGSVRVTFREPVSARIVIADLAPRSNVWRVSDVSQVGGFGLVSISPSGSGTVLATRDDEGLVAFGPGSGWTHGGVPLVHAPGLQADEQGRHTVLALGPDGLLYTARQTAARADAPLGPWSAASGTARLSG
jgi:LmbE family N-acetylglucosaminyl deacetylase